MVNKNDLVIGISTSGNSKNVVNGLKTAKEMGAYTIGLVGNTDGEIIKIVDQICHIKTAEGTLEIPMIDILESTISIQHL